MQVTTITTADTAAIIDRGTIAMGTGVHA